MKKLITNYSFNKATKQVTFNDYTTLDVDAILLITNIVVNKIIYNFAVSGLGGTVSGNVVTLSYDTSTMNNTDGLQIYYDDVQYQESTFAAQDLLNNLTIAIGEMITRLDVIAGMANSGAPALRITPITPFYQATQPISGTVSLNNPTIADQLLTGGVPTSQLVKQQGNATVELGNIKNATA